MYLYIYELMARFELTEIERSFVLSNNLSTVHQKKKIERTSSSVRGRESNGRRRGAFQRVLIR